MAEPPKPMRISREGGEGVTYFPSVQQGPGEGAALLGGGWLPEGEGTPLQDRSEGTKKQGSD